MVWTPRNLPLYPPLGIEKRGGVKLVILGVITTERGSNVSTVCLDLGAEHAHIKLVELPPPASKKKNHPSSHLCFWHSRQPPTQRQLVLSLGCVTASALTSLISPVNFQGRCWLRLQAKLARLRFTRFREKCIETRDNLCWNQVRATTVNSRLADTSLYTDAPLILTAAKSPAKVTDIWLKQTPAITDLWTLMFSSDDTISLFWVLS